MTAVPVSCDCEVLVVGGGPTGLVLACLLARAGVDVVVLERRAALSGHSRAIGLHPPALAVLDELGLAEQAVAEGVTVRSGAARARGRTLGELTFERAWPDRPFVLTLPQNRTEELLRERLAELAPTALRTGRQVLDLADDGEAVRAAVRTTTGPEAGGETSWRAGTVVGADGARSIVRARSGIGIRTRRLPDTYLMGDVVDRTDLGRTAAIHLEPDGVVESFPLPGGLRRWVVHTGTRLREASPDELAAVVRSRTGVPVVPQETTMTSSFAVRRSLAERMVSGRRVIIGDAAHEISPIGGRGMTLGWLDAASLAPLLVEQVAAGDCRPVAELAGLRHMERVRMRAARASARRAELNMALGRPRRGPVARLREAALAGLLGTPLRHRLAGSFTMRGVRLTSPGRLPRA